MRNAEGKSIRRFKFFATRFGTSAASHTGDCPNSVPSAPPGPMRRAHKIDHRLEAKRTRRLFDCHLQIQWTRMSSSVLLPEYDHVGFSRSACRPDERGNPAHLGDPRRDMDVRAFSSHQPPVLPLPRLGRADLLRTRQDHRHPKHVWGCTRKFGLPAQQAPRREG